MYPEIIFFPIFAASSFSSRLAPVYNEVAPVFYIFGQLFGKALEVQVLIISCNFGCMLFNRAVTTSPELNPSLHCTHRPELR